MAEWGVECLHKFVKISCKFNSFYPNIPMVTITVFRILMNDDQIINKKRRKYSSSFSAHRGPQKISQKPLFVKVIEIDVKISFLVQTRVECKKKHQHVAGHGNILTFSVKHSRCLF